MINLGHCHLCSWIRATCQDPGQNLRWSASTAPTFGKRTRYSLQGAGVGDCCAMLVLEPLVAKEHASATEKTSLSKEV